MENSPRFVFIDEEWENLTVINDSEELTRNIIDVHYVANAGESIFSVTMWNIAN